MSLVLLLGLMLLATALPDLVPSILSIDRHPPDLWAIAALYLAFRARGFRSVGWAIGIGLVRDCVSLDPFGTHGFVLGVVAYIVCEGQTSRGRIDGGMRALLTGAGVLGASWLYLLRILPLGGGVVTFGAFVDAVPVALWSTLMALGLYPVFDRFGLFDEICGRARALST